MSTENIISKIKEIISNIANIPVAEISDTANFRDELDLDSLSLLEIGVDVAYEFKLEIPEEELTELADLPGAVNLVERYLAPAEARAAAV